MFRQFTRKLHNNIAFVFDIDGVLLRGSNPIPRAKEALELLQKNQVPFILLTNGGGQTEKERMSFLSQRIGVELSPLQLVQSHTPMKALTSDYDRVMVVGGPDDKARHCALEYGFKDIIMPIDLIKSDPSISPHHRYTPQELSQYAHQVNLDKPVDAVLMFNDPRDLNTDIQVVLDVLNSINGKIGTKRRVHHDANNSNTNDKPAVPMIFSNNDFLWANDYPLPRFGQGAVRMMIERLYAEQNFGAKLQRTILGKPFKIQYDYAHHVLIDWEKRLKSGEAFSNKPQILPKLNSAPEKSPFSKIFMVGDNPASDIQGANTNGWESILLRTGVYRDEDWADAVAHPTVGVFDDVYQSVSQTLLKNGY